MFCLQQLIWEFASCLWQVRVVTRKLCEPLEEDSFRPILHHYDGPKFRLELNIPEVLTSLDLLKVSASIIIIGNPTIN